MGLLDGKTAIITGASRGIGAETARLFAREGANVVLVARSEAAIAALAEEIGPRAMAVALDISDYSGTKAMVEAATERFGTPDILINNAGVIEPIARLTDADPAAWSKVIDINLKGVFNGAHAVAGAMAARGSGTIITISSGAAHNALEGWSHYCVSKAGAAMLTDCLHKELAESGLRIMGLSPGTVATEMQVQIKASGINPVSQLDFSVHIPADWPAKCLLWMCTPDADAYLGQEISLRDETIRATLGLSA
ncbi:Glucose 1-dehydrogenase 2 [Pseudoruegeria aquimaris]|uniref:Glucose 1-dehydrogenase 2 n=1 Tax=Pseudoruegeria aquimaris TaxID=393663 RepID=A0A1Y5TP50_9RHOB|nr:SDR family oxidoreductase [Pseudoruegeria aquimaris]SLN68782.1 Glucose 1-dehydrogenase 2 [Pseudoruegeria aquimaris]